MIARKSLATVALIMVAFSLTHSCSSTSNIIGEYQSKDGRYNLTIFEDSTFAYEYKFGYHQDFSDGTWILNSNRLSFESRLNDINRIPIAVQEWYDPNLKNLCKIYIESKLNVDTCCYFELIINNEDSIRNVGPEITFQPKGDIRSIQVLNSCPDCYRIPFRSDTTVSSSFHQIEASNSNCFLVLWDVDYRAYNYKVIDSCKAIVRKRRVIIKEKDLVLKMK